MWLHVLRNCTWTWNIIHVHLYHMWQCQSFRELGRRINRGLSRTATVWFWRVTLSCIVQYFADFLFSILCRSTHCRTHLNTSHSCPRELFLHRVIYSYLFLFPGVPTYPVYFVYPYYRTKKTHLLQRSYKISTYQRIRVHFVLNWNLTT